MNTSDRVKLTSDLLTYKNEHKSTVTPMRDLFVHRYGDMGLTTSTVLIIWDDWCKVTRMAGISNVQRRGSQWTENGVIIREGLNIIK